MTIKSLPGAVHATPDIPRIDCRKCYPADAISPLTKVEATVQP